MTQIDDQIRILITGLADQAIANGQGFKYDGGRLLAEDVAAFAAPSVLCLAQDLSERLGLGGFGMSFALEREPNPIFPLRVDYPSEGIEFYRVAPFVAEVFDGEVLDCRQDLTRLFVSAAKILDPKFDLPVYPAGQISTVAQDADQGIAAEESFER